MLDHDREKILARRARLVAAALVALGTEGCKPPPAVPPEACLSPVPGPEVYPCLATHPPEPESDAGPASEPQVCLSQPRPESADAGAPGPFAEPPPGKS